MQVSVICRIYAAEILLSLTIGGFVFKLQSEVSPPETYNERCNSTMSKSVMKGKRKRCVSRFKDNAKTNKKSKT